METTGTLSPEILAAAVGAFLGFIFAIATNLLWQAYLDKRNRIQLTYFTEIEIPLSIAKQELKEKLEVYYNNRKIEDIYYAKLTIKNTGQKTVKNQFFTCAFHKDSKSIDSKFPLITTIPEKEVPIQNISQVGADRVEPNVYRYKVEALGPDQIIQVDFLLDGSNKDFKTLFRPNEFDEVKIVEGALSTDPTLEFYIVQIALSIFLYIATLKIGTAFAFLGGNTFAIFLALPLLFNAFWAFRKLIPLLFKSNFLRNDNPVSNDIVFGNGSQSGVVIGGGTVKITPTKNKKDKKKRKK